MARPQPSNPLTHTKERLYAAMATAGRRKVETRTIQPARYSAAPARSDKPTRAQPTRERGQRAPEGIEQQPMSRNVGDLRARVKAPWEMIEERIGRVAAELAKEPEPYYRPLR